MIKLPTLKDLREISGWIARKGWRESFARGDGLGSLGGGAGGCSQPGRQSAWVFACLQIIAGTVRSVPLKWDTLNREGEAVPFLDQETALFWQQPAETASGPLSFGDFIELSLAWINLRGQACWVLDDTWLTPRGVKSPIMLARTDRLSAIKRGETILGWQYIDGLGGKYILLPQQVVRPRFLNPYDDAEGLAPLEAARIAVDADYAASVFSRNVAMSNGDQGVYIVNKGGGMLSDEQQEQIVATLKQKALLSKRGEYRPAFLTADVAVEDPKIKTVDAAFISGRAVSRNEIFVAFGVPPSMAEVTASYSVGSASDRYRLIEQTCIPHSMRLCQAIAQIERLRSGRNLNAELDWSQHPVMAQIRAERAKAAAEMWKTGIPWEVLNQMHDLGMTGFPGWRDAWLPMNLERVTKAQATNADEEDETETDGQDQAADSKKALAASGAALQDLRRLMESPALASCCEHHGKSGGGDGDHKPDPERLKLWQKHMTARRPSEKLMLKKITKAIMAARAETLEKLDSSDKALSGARARGVLDILFDLQAFTLAMVEGTKAAHKDALEQALLQFAEEIGEDDPWTMESEKVLNFINKRENRIRDCCREIHEDIKAELEEGLREGESNADLAKRVRAAFTGISKDRAEMIAATEVTAAYGYARHEAMQGLDIEEKEWLSAQDGRVRDTHMRADGQTVPMDEPFIVELKDGGTEELMYPGDSNGSAENVIRCRCVQIPKRQK